MADTRVSRALRAGAQPQKDLAKKLVPAPGWIRPFLDLADATMTPQTNVIYLWIHQGPKYFEKNADFASEKINVLHISSSIILYYASIKKKAEKK